MTVYVQSTFSLITEKILVEFSAKYFQPFALEYDFSNPY